ncbi:HNH endonuclease [Vibrio parahaemolyticus]|uniref:HNH endonuclease n=1 Tax=Vibrio parahaemolyticus TaxID=670 RepID=UPI0015DDC697
MRRRDKSLCQSCLEAGRVVAGNEFDHIIAVINMTEPHDQFWDADNIRCLCSACHAIKTAKDQKEARQR